MCQYNGIKIFKKFFRGHYGRVRERGNLPPRSGGNGSWLLCGPLKFQPKFLITVGSFCFPIFRRKDLHQ